MREDPERRAVGLVPVRTSAAPLRFQMPRWEYSEAEDEDFYGMLVLQVGSAEMEFSTWDPKIIRGWERQRQVVSDFVVCMRSVIETGYDDGTHIYEPYA